MEVSILAVEWIHILLSEEFVASMVNFGLIPIVALPNVRHVVVLLVLVFGWVVLRHIPSLRVLLLASLQVLIVELALLFRCFLAIHASKASGEGDQKSNGSYHLINFI